MPSSGERRLEASREAVWVALSEPDVLRRCLPGCRSVERISDVEFAIGARLPRAADAGGAFTGALRLGDVDPPAGFRFTAELRNRHGRVVAASGRVDLTAAGEATLLRYELALSGDALAQGEAEPGDRASLLAEAFFARFERALAASRGEPRPAAAAPQAPATGLAQEPRPGLRPVIWVPALMLAVALILYSSS